jgi:hypothetical protein
MRTPFRTNFEGELFFTRLNFDGKPFALTVNIYFMYQYYSHIIFGSISLQPIKFLFFWKKTIPLLYKNIPLPESYLCLQLRISYCVSLPVRKGFIFKRDHVFSE